MEPGLIAVKKVAAAKLSGTRFRVMIDRAGGVYGR